MRFMLLVYSDEKILSEDDRQACYRDSAALTRELSASGQYIDAAPLHLTDTATSVRVRDGKAEIVDGPFAETREQLGGYYLVEAATLDEALAIAKKIPVAAYGTIEVRPVMDIPGLPETGQE